MPKLEPVKWNESSKRDFAGWLHSELFNCIGDRGPLETKWESLIEQHRASLPSGQKDFPWVGASNIEFPLAAMHADPVLADMYQSFHAAEDYWTPVASRPDRVPHANALREALKHVNKRFLRMKKVNVPAFLSQVVLGNAVYKTHWMRQELTKWGYGQDGKRERQTRYVSQPVIDYVPLQHFYIPANAWDISPDAPVCPARWVGEKFFLTKEALLSRKNADPKMPGYDPALVDIVVQHETDLRDDKIDEKIRKLDEFQPFLDRKIELFEVYARYDVDGDGVEDDVQVIWHQPTSSIMRAVYHPFRHGRRPYRRALYLPGFGFYGMGIAELDEWAQSIITSLVNAQVDNVMVVNTRMYAVPYGSGVQPGDPVYPGKYFFYNPGEQPPSELKLGDIHPSLPQTIQQFLQWSEMRTAVSEIRQGNIQGLPSRTPATTLLSILREGNKRFDMIHSMAREEHGEMGKDVVLLLAEEYQEDPLRWRTFFERAMGPEDAALVAEVLEGDLEEIEENFGIEVTATSAQVNKEVEKQSFVGLMQIVMQSFNGMIQTAGILQNPQIVPGTPMFETAAANYMAGIQLITQLLARFDIQNPSEYLGNMQSIAGALTATQQGVNPALAATGMMPTQQPMLDPMSMLAGNGGVPQVAPSQFGALFGL